ncbi:hypothetical protein ACIP98_21215 [Streptomyces sp. NPDC088354]|uniref:hypothetical protein n=1 Tax=Streptomyces sp. NPDC088354 TaxID=3365856 RepID=UPI003819E7A4
MTTTDPVAADAEPAPVDWNQYPYDQLLVEQRPAVEAYEAAVASVREACAVTAGDLRDCAVIALEAGLSAAHHVDGHVRMHLALLDTWHQALDSLDAALRNAAGHHTAPTREIVSDEAAQMQDAVQALHRAVIAYHHGATGPVPDAAYGDAYALSNGTIHAAASTMAIMAASPAARERQASVDHVLRAKAAEIMALGEANDWSIWAAHYLHPDVEFVNTGEQSGETLAAVVQRRHRAAAFHEAAEAVAALDYYSRHAGTEFDHARDAWITGKFDAVELLRQKATAPAVPGTDPVTTALHWRPGTEAIVTVDEQPARGHYVGCSVEPGGADGASLLVIRVLVSRPDDAPEDCPEADR